MRVSVVLVAMLVWAPCAALAQRVGVKTAAPGTAAAVELATAAGPGAPGQLDWASGGWSPAADWRTLEVAGYRLHFPAPAEPWARHLAARLPDIRARVAGAVGWDATETVDVVLVDPIAQPNGAAWPLLGRPRLVLLLTPPGASSQLAEFVDWPELLVVHEQAHLSHLLRPSRQPLMRLVPLPVGPISLRAPRWVVEGYATLVEGRLTGSGRPSGALRAAVLRRWAQRGQLPDYSALAGDSRRYLGGAQAYLAGSAFLEWLERRTGEGSLDRLWRRLTARRRRGFEDAFRGVFGDTPAALWGRFSAELTWQAVEVERRTGAGGSEGEPWLERSWGTGRPALSRDGSRLVLALTSRQAPPRLAVYATAVDAAAEKRRDDEQRRLLARDPEDAPAVRSGAPRREPLASLELAGTTVDPAPRFLPDGSVLFARSLPDAEGSYHSDLFRWWPDRGGVERLTRAADLHAADPAPDGTWAAAVQSRWGQTRLVRVELGSGALAALSPPSVEVVVDAPRVSPDARRLAFLRHRGDGWVLVVRGLAAGSEEVVTTPSGAAVQDPAWAPAGDAIYAVVGEGGLLGVQRLPIGGAAAAGRDAAAGEADAAASKGDAAASEGDATASEGDATASDGAVGEGDSAASEGDAAGGEGAPLRVASAPGAALAPEPTPDDTALFFLALEPEGMQVRRVELATTAAGGAPPVALGVPSPAAQQRSAQPTTAPGGEDAADSPPGSAPASATASLPAAESPPPGAPPADLATLDPAELYPALPPAPSPPPAPVPLAEVPPSRDYGLGRAAWSELSGVSTGTGGSSAELGARGGDLVGRWDLLALGAYGSDGGARGAALAAAWRGWPVEVSAHGYAARERPSAQRRQPAPQAAVFGLEARGVELAAAWHRALPSGGGAAVRLAGGAETLDALAGDATTRRSGRLDLAIAEELRRGRWRAGGELALAWQPGTTGGARWDRRAGRVDLELARGDTGLALALERQDVGGSPTAVDQLRVGGLPSTLLPPLAVGNRVLAPGLPAAALVGRAYEGERLALTLPGLPLRPFWERHRVEGDAGWSDWLALAGLDFELRLPPLPLLDLPGARLQVGAAYVLDEPYRRDVNGWLAVTWRP